MIFHFSEDREQHFDQLFSENSSLNELYFISYLSISKFNKKTTSTFLINLNIVSQCKIHSYFNPRYNRLWDIMLLANISAIKRIDIF